MLSGGSHVSLLIDGYNLLFAAGFSDPSPSAPRLAHARLALLEFVARSVAPSERPRTTVVFDAAQAPRNLPRELVHREMAVRFAVGYASADDLLEELIRKDSAPRRLVVVSSDHRVQRAARRRRATAIDAGEWYMRALARQRAGGCGDWREHGVEGGVRGEHGMDRARLRASGRTGQASAATSRQNRRTPSHGAQPPSEGPGPAPGRSAGEAAGGPAERFPRQGPDEVAFWLRQFTEGDDAVDPGLLRELQGIFPPGYAEDVWSDEG